MSEQIARLRERLRKIKGNDPVSCARRIAIQQQILKLMAEGITQ